MRQSVLEFFSTAHDMQAVLEKVEQVHDLRYFWLEKESSAEVSVWSRATDIPNFMSVQARIQSGVTSGLVYISTKDDIPTPEENQHTRGYTWYSLHPKDVGSAVVLQQGGAYESGFIASRVYQTPIEGDAQAVFRTMKAQMRKQFKRVKGYHVGADAYEALCNGARLTGSWDLKPEYDLQLDT
ncbi:MAG: hypothetical protein P1U83_14520 [Roseovarius sp.]|jgi:hypothetical protein|nr:hypothetical protein [Roseovarius sp.]